MQVYYEIAATAGGVYTENFEDYGLKQEYTIGGLSFYELYTYGGGALAICAPGYDYVNINGKLLQNQYIASVEYYEAVLSDSGRSSAYHGSTKQEGILLSVQSQYGYHYGNRAEWGYANVKHFIKGEGNDDIAFLPVKSTLIREFKYNSLGISYIGLVSDPNLSPTRDDYFLAGVTALWTQSDKTELRGGIASNA